MRKFRRPWWIAVGAVAVLVALAGWALATGSSAPGAEEALLQVRSQIDQLGSAAVTGQGERLQLLETERQRLLDAIQNPGPATDGDSATTATRSEGAKWVADEGEVECEAMPPFTNDRDLAGARCVSIARPSGAALFVFLTPRSVALVITYTTDGVSDRLVIIPPLPDLAEASLSVDGGDIHVRESGQDLLISTVVW
jgi:hypothetical protein